MKKIINDVIVLIFLSLLPIGMAQASTKFKIEMQNHTHATLKFYCQSITGSHRAVFPRGYVVVPPRTSVTEDVEIARSGASKAPHEEIQCSYAGGEMAMNASAVNSKGFPMRVMEKTTDSVAIDASFGGVLTLMVTPAISHHHETHRTLDTRAEFVVSFEKR